MSNESTGFTPEELKKILGFKFRVAEVTVNGLNRTKDDLVRATVEPLLQAASFEQIVHDSGVTAQRLKELGCFNGVTVLVDTVEGSAASGGATKEDAVKVSFNVQEHGLLQARVKQQVGVDEFSVEGVGGLRNVFGRGEEASFSYVKGPKRTNLEVAGAKTLHTSYLQPTLRATVFQQLAEAQWAGFSQTDKGAQLQCQIQPFAGLISRATAEAVWRHLEVAARETPFAVREHAGHSLKTSLRHELLWDSRDEAVFPGCGALFRWSAEVAAAPGNVSFIKNHFDLSKSFTLASFATGDLAAHFSVGGGLLTAHTAHSRPQSVADRFVVGGLPRLAGWERGGLGRVEGGAGVGCESYWAAGVRLNAPIPLLPPSGLTARTRLFAFATAANTGGDKLDALPDQLLTAPRLSLGAGLAWNLFGLARLELYWSLPLAARAGDRAAPGLGWGLAVDG